MNSQTVLLGGHLPKIARFDTINDEIINQIENALNSRPRAVLGFDTPEMRLLQKINYIALEA